MNKKLIAIAVAASFAAPMAVQAEATPYANVQFEVFDFDDGKTKAAGSDSGMYVGDRERGRVGLKGSEDLGGGMKAIAMVEFDFVGGNDDSEFGDASDTDSAGDTVKVRGNGLRVREIMAGIKAGFGEIQIGTLKSAYKYTGGVKYDPFVTTTLEARGDYGMSGGTKGHNGFLNNMLAYKNKFGALSVWATYSPDETDRDGDGNADDGELTYAVKFSSGNIEAFVSGYDGAFSDSTKEYSSNKIGGKFKLGGGTAVLAQYELADSAGKDITNTFVGFHFGMGKNTLVAQYGIQDKDEAVDTNDSGTMLTVGAVHKFSKKARVFVGYKQVDGDAAGAAAKDETTTSIGLRVDI